MGRRFIVILSAILVLTAISASQATAQPGSSPLQRKIVVFQPGFREPAAQDALLARFGTPIKPLRIINGWAVALPAAALAPLAERAEVLRIDDDVEVRALDAGSNGKGNGNGKGGKPQEPQPDETLPWGVDRIDAELAWPSSYGSGVKVAVIDTGIDLSHADLKDNIKGGYNALNPRKSAKDDNGHGTHVAGTIAAVDNNIGVVGVAPQASLYAVKVLNSQGSGFLSDVIEGIEWAANNGMQVINMSLGWGGDIQSAHDAVLAAKAANIVIVASAGNSGPDEGTVAYPAKYSEVIAVAATCGTTNPNGWCPGGFDSAATFSSRGSEVELAAPGVDILSTWVGGGYNTISGTSMASPHVAGVAALVIAANPGISADNVRARLNATADDLGAAGWDSTFGNGMVDAQDATG